MQQEKRQQQVKSARANPLAFSSIASQPRSFSYTPKMARSAKCTFCVAMALGHARQATGEILTGNLGLPELAFLLSASSPVGPVTPPRSEPLHCHAVTACDCTLFRMTYVTPYKVILNTTKLSSLLDSLCKFDAIFQTLFSRQNFD